MTTPSVELIVIDAIHKRIGGFTAGDICHMCPAVSRSTITIVLKKMVQSGEIKRFGTGRSTRYLRSDAFK